MDEKQIEDNWNRSTGKFRELVGRLCVAAVASIGFKHRSVVDELQDRYGCVKGQQAHEELLDEFVQRLRQ